MPLNNYNYKNRIIGIVCESKTNINHFMNITLCYFKVRLYTYYPNQNHLNLNVVAT
jgi:hypothetical protein